MPPVIPVAGTWLFFSYPVEAQRPTGPSRQHATATPAVSCPSPSSGMEHVGVNSDEPAVWQTSGHATPRCRTDAEVLAMSGHTSSVGAYDKDSVDAPTQLTVSSSSASFDDVGKLVRFLARSIIDAVHAVLDDNPRGFSALDLLARTHGILGECTPQGRTWPRGERRTPYQLA